MVISVAEYVKDNRVREAVRRSDHIRCRTLERCYSIPEYVELSPEEKNAVYDKVRNDIVEREDKS